MRAQSPLAGPKDARRPGSFRSVVRSAGSWPGAPRARRIPSIVAQSSPALFAAAFRFAANFGESRRAGGVGSGSGEFSQIVAALSGPSISGVGAGLVLGSSTLRSCVHCACASLRLPPERRAPRPFELDEFLVALE